MQRGPEGLARALADRYLIEREVGAGGMATVYLAHDVRHDRKVAIKVLRPELSAIVGAGRFLAEIKTTAHLQHPHILSLFDSGEADGQVYYVMPFVEGESLRDRLEREKQLPVDDALRIAREVADALQYAHQHGVVHRDIKPENVLLHGGHAMVADFGIALAASRTEGGSRMTETGMSLGTPHYMSPEQAMGAREITARSDVYALGVMLYEMLTGDPPFTGSTPQAIVARVLTEAPRSVTSQRHTVPTGVEEAIFTALEKLPADRFATAAEFAQALGRGGMESAQRTGGAPARGGTVALAVGRRRRWVTPAALGAALLIGLSAGRALWRSPPPAVTRVALGLPNDQRLAPLSTGLRLAISPDGRRIVYPGPAENGTQLWLRDLDQLEATPLPGSTGSTSPFFSPDGTKLGFFAGTGYELRVLTLGGGPPLTLVPSGNTSGGGVWSSDGYIYYDTIDGLRRISEAGGASEPAVPLDTLRQDVGHAYPDVTPNGRGIIYRLRRAGEDPRNYRVMATDLRSGEQKELVPGLIARYVEPGYLVYATVNGDLLAAPFDQDKLEITGGSVALLQGVATGGLGAVDAVISRNGTLLYVSGTVQSAVTLAWIDRAGRPTQIELGESGNGLPIALALSPDGRSVALTLRDPSGGEDIWMKDLVAGPLSRLTFTGGNNIRPVWSPDGRTILYARSDSTGQSALLRIRADGGAPAEQLRRFRQVMTEVLPSPDGRWILLRPIVGGGVRINSGMDIYGWRPGADTALVPLVASEEIESGPALSPDGRWLAYTVGLGLNGQVFVRPFPNTADARYQISVNGGSEPRWGRSGRELFYRNAIGEQIAVQVRTSPSFVVVEQRSLFSARSLVRMGNHFAYEVAPGDQRFLALRLGGIDERGGDLILVQNWRVELERAFK